MDADRSAAAHKNYTEQIGLITIGFFRPEPKGTRGGRLGTELGPGERTRLEEYKGGKIPGTVMTVYNIRYLTPETLRKLQK